MPFGGWRDGNGLDGRGLAKLLKPYKVKPDSIRVPPDNPKTVKGYLRQWFEDAWGRWLPPTEAEHAEHAEQAPQEAADVPDVPDLSEGREDELRDFEQVL